jgi:hypothetical protein
MSTFNALNVADGNAVSDRINSIVSDTIGGTYPLVSATNPITNNTLATDGQSLLSNLGIDVNDRSLTAASIIVNNISNGTLRDVNVSDFKSYDSNLSTGGNTSPYGDIANAFNTLYDEAASQILGPSNTVVTDALSSTYTPTTTAEALAQQGANSGNTQVNGGNPGNISTLTSPNYYAYDLIPYQPKIRYTYIAQMTMYGEYQQDVPNTCTFLIKQFDKPKTSIEYEEVNFYNFFSQVPKRSKFEQVSFELHNDIKNESMNFIVSYLRRVCPIFNQEQAMGFEENGMNFDNANSSYGLHTTTSNTNIIQSIKIFDIFNGNRTMDVYTFNNPKITSIDMSQWNMEDGGGSIITVNLVYDNWYLDTGVEPKIPTNTLGLSELAASNTQVLTSAGAGWDKKYTNLLSVNEKDPTVQDPASNFDVNVAQDVQDGQVGEDTLSTDQLNTISSQPFTFGKDINNLNIIKNEPVTLPLAEELAKPLATNPTIPGLNVDQVALSLTPKFDS